MSKKLAPKDPTVQMIADLKDGVDGTFWKTLRKIIASNILDTERDIFQAAENGYTHEKVMNLIDWRNFLDHFLTLPEQVIASLEQGETDPVDFDPFQKVKEKLDA